MNKRSFALIFSILVIVALIIMGVAFFSRSFSERNLVQTHIHSTRAFWLAEAGIAQAINSFDSTQPFPQGIPQTTLGTAGQTFQATIFGESPVGSGIHTIQSLGTVTLPSGRTIQRRIQVNVQEYVPPAIPPDVINAPGPVTTRPGVIVDPADINAPSIDGNPPAQPFAPFTFQSVFAMTKPEMKSIAHHVFENLPAEKDYKDIELPPGGIPIEGITWVELPPGSGWEVNIQANWWTGSGILIIEGDANTVNFKFNGGEFHGIVWLTGKTDFPVAGDAKLYGTMFVDCPPGDSTDFRGGCELIWDRNDITQAFGQIPPTIMPGTWQEYEGVKWGWEP